MVQAYYDSNIDQLSSTRSSVCWGSVSAGVVAGMIVQVVLSLLGLAIGFNIFDPGQSSYTGLGIGSTIWLISSALLSGFTGGWVTTALANLSNRFQALMHGVLSWGVFMIIAFYLFGSGLGTFLGGAFNLSSAAITGASQRVVAQTATRTSGVAAVREQANEVGQTMNEPSTPAQERQQRIQQEQAANTAAKATWGAFIVALLSLTASAFGGVVGLKRRNYQIPAAV